MAQQFLDQDGLVFLYTQIKNLIEQETQLNITTTLDGDSTNQQIPGAAAVYAFVTNTIGSLTHIRMEIVATLPTTGEPNVIYLVRVGTSNVYAQHVFINGEWIELGTTEIDLSNFWSKDALTALTNTDIQDIIDDVMGV